MPCHKGSLTEVHIQSKGHFVANNLLCINFLKVDPSKDGKENVLLLTDTFTKFSQAFVITNQKAFTIAKILVNKWFYVYGTLACIHSDKSQSVENDIISHLYSHV